MADQHTPEPLSVEEERSLRNAIARGEPLVRFLVTSRGMSHAVGRLLATLDAARASRPEPGADLAGLEEQRLAALPASPKDGLDVERKRYAAALREIADWNAHSDDCPGYRGGDVCSCGWVEIADVARTALDSDGTALLEITSAALKEPTP